MDNPKMKSFTEFWPFYLQEHSKKSTKLVHFIGTSIGLVFVYGLLFSLI